MKKAASLLTFLVATMCVAAWGADQSLTVIAPDYFLSLNQKWASSYGKGHPGFHAEVNSATGASNVFAALAEKRADIAIGPRAMKFKEAQSCETALGKKPLDFKLGVNGVAVYVAQENPVKTLTYIELEGIFTGRFTNWKDLGGNDAPIQVLVQDPNSASGELFKEEVLNSKPFKSDARTMSDADLLDVIAKYPNAIGFGRLASTPGARALAIKRAPSSTPVTPSEDNISNRTYPVSRYVFGYLSPAAKSSDGQAFLDWVRTDDGQQAVKDSGFFPLPAKLRATQ